MGVPQRRFRDVRGPGGKRYLLGTRDKENQIDMVPPPGAAPSLLPLLLFNLKILVLADPLLTFWKAPLHYFLDLKLRLKNIY